MCLFYNLILIIYTYFVGCEWTRDLIHSITSCIILYYIYNSLCLLCRSQLEALNMNVSTENFTSPEVHPSTNLTTDEDLLLNGFRVGLLSFNLLFGVPTHSYILWLIFQGGRIPSEFFNINLTVCDLIYSLIVLFYPLKVIKHLEEVHRFLQGLGVTGRPLFQCLICVERYLAVVHPVIFLKYKPLRYRVICCTVVWIITLGSCFVAMILQMLSNLETYTWFFSLQFLLFLSIQLFCLVAVLRALKQSGPGERAREREEEDHMKRRAFYLILITTATLVVMFVPFIVTGFIGGLQLIEQKEVKLIWFLSICCFILAGFVQPVLYLHRAGKLFCFYSS